MNVLTLAGANSGVGCGLFEKWYRVLSAARTNLAFYAIGLCSRFSQYRLKVIAGKA